MQQKKKDRNVNKELMRKEKKALERVVERPVMHLNIKEHLGSRFTFRV
jgi:hypothetical protein